MTAPSVIANLSFDARFFLQRLASAPAVWVQVAATRGSVPRETGAWMAVFADGLIGTVGGGKLEFDAIGQARALLLAGGDLPAPWLVRFALGPTLGQCCGGVVDLRFEPVTSLDVTALQTRLSQQLTPVAIFGSGHVGRALVRVLGTLPFAVSWMDSREGSDPAQELQFAAQPPESLPVVCEHSDPIHAAVPHLPAQSRVLIMSFSHAEDFDIVAACLSRQRTQGDLPFIGLIGSRTKWASFRQRLQARGFSEAERAHITCPIGMAGIVGKAPEVIAVAVAAQLLLLA